MQCRISFKNMKSSEALSDYASGKVVQKIERYSTKPIEAHITFTLDGSSQKVHCNVLGGDGFNIQVEASCSDMYGSVDLLLDKLEAQLKKHKEKLKKHNSTGNIKTLRAVEPQDKGACDAVPVNADDLIKYEKARLKAYG